MKITRKQYMYALIAGVLALLAMLFRKDLRFLAAVVALTAAASISTFYQNFFKSPVNFELIKLATILVSVSYGLIAGLAVGIISTIASKIISERLDHTSFSSIIGIAVVAVLAAMFSNIDIVTLGIGLTVVYHIITAPMQMAMGGTLAYGAVYVGTNLLFNIALFSRLAPFLKSIM